MGRTEGKGGGWEEEGAKGWWIDGRRGEDEKGEGGEG